MKSNILEIPEKDKLEINVSNINKFKSSLCLPKNENTSLKKHISNTFTKDSSKVKKSGESFLLPISNSFSI